MKNYLAIILTILTIVSCKNVKGGQDEKLFEEVMALHDEIMPVTTKLNGLQNSLKAILAEPDSIPGGITKEEVIEVSMHTEKAYNGMMDWMRDFKIPENMNNNEKTIYLKNQKAILTKLKEETMSAYNEAEVIINPKK